MNIPQRFLLMALPAVLIGLSGCSSFSSAADPADHREIQRFASEVAARHGMNADDIERLVLEEARHQPEIIEAITSPAEALPWHRYRQIFITEERIAGGVAYQAEHADWLSRVSARYGVPAEIVTAIIGVETYYGRYRGRHRVIDALRTLGFAYPPRAEFFRSELEAFLVLANEEGMDPTVPLGSYAGAMGVPQFISSSYRAYAVDFNENGRRDLFSEPADAIGSVGNYFAEHRWQPGAPIAAPATVSGGRWRDFLREALQPVDTVGDLRRAGVRTDPTLDDNLPARLLALETTDGMAYWVTLNNFYVITRYNHSPLYAMAVYELATAIREASQ